MGIFRNGFNINYYGLSHEEYKKVRTYRNAGNYTSMLFVIVFEFIFFAIVTGINIYRGVLPYSQFYLFVSLVLLLSFFIFRKTAKNHSVIFFYLAFFLSLSYGTYNMSMETYSSAILFPAFISIFPLLFMDCMLNMAIFMGIFDVFIFILAYGFPDTFGYMQLFSGYVVIFTFVGLGLHYCFQINRIRELVGMKDRDSQRKMLEIKSNFETLTKLLRRRTFVDMAVKAINRNEDKFLALGILDIDHFKLINDTYGHQVGDETIRAIGEVLAETLDIQLKTPENPEDCKLDWNQDYGNIAGRLGGDEFIFLISSERNADGVQKLFENVIKELNKTSVGPLSGIQGSIGYIVVDENNLNYDLLYKKADLALYTAKAEGKNKAVEYDERQSANIHSKEAENIDSVTGLLTMNAFKERAAKEIRKPNNELAIVFFDIDGFKNYNAEYGFENGDLFLKTLAHCIVDQYPGCLISRFGDDHFAALVPTDNLEHKLGKIKYMVRKEKAEFYSAIRTGVYEIMSCDIDINIACDRAKYAGDIIRGRYDVGMQYFDDKLNEQVKRQEHIIAKLDEAIEKNWIKLYLQPVVRAYSGHICGYEALSRWDDPSLGLLPPNSFIDVLERFHLIYKLDLFIVEELCKNYQYAIERNLDVLPISVNLSRIDFDVCNIVQEIESLIKEYNVPRHMIHIEVTESVVTEDDTRIMDDLAHFQQLGYQVWMDDFGSGYSSLNMLKDFQFDVIKLDMKFLSDTSARSVDVLTSIVSMAKKLGMQTLCEGVETFEQYKILRSIGCDLLQGYYFGKPEHHDANIFEEINGQDGYEKLADREYYDTLGSINILNTIVTNEDGLISDVGDRSRTALVEWRDNKVKYLMYTKQYEDFICAAGHASVEEFERDINQGKIDSIERFDEILRKNKEANGNTQASQILNIAGKKYVQHVRIVAENQRNNRTTLQFLVVPYIELKKGISFEQED